MDAIGASWCRSVLCAWLCVMHDRKMAFANVSRSLSARVTIVSLVRGGSYDLLTSFLAAMVRWETPVHASDGLTL